MSTPVRIYAACLAAYNAGTLHGAWIDCEGKDADELQAEVAAMLAASPEPGAEEMAIHDHEGFGGLIGEYTPLAKIAEHAAMVAEHGDAWIAFCEHIGVDYATESDFQELYWGAADSEKAFAEQYAEDTGDLASIPEHLQCYFDYDAYARDLFINSFYFEDGHVFRRE